MPSSLHEALVELFRNQPDLAADLLTGPLKIDLPDFEQARLESGELTEVTPTEYRADAVVVLTKDSTAVLGVVVEAQLARDPGKTPAQSSGCAGFGSGRVVAVGHRGQHRQRRAAAGLCRVGDDRHLVRSEHQRLQDEAGVSELDRGGAASGGARVGAQDE